MGCLFCNIINGSVPSNKVYEDEHVFAFEDINPQSPVHVLVIPKEHVSDLTELGKKDSDIMKHVFKAVDKVAEIKNIRDQGYRVIINNGKAAGQVIWHLHIHVMGGKESLGPMLSE